MFDKLTFKLLLLSSRQFQCPHRLTHQICYLKASQRHRKTVHPNLQMLLLIIPVLLSLLTSASKTLAREKTQLRSPSRIAVGSAAIRTSDPQRASRSGYASPVTRWTPRASHPTGTRWLDTALAAATIPLVSLADYYESIRN